MIKNNIEVDVKVKCIENETTQAQLAENNWNYEPVCQSYHQKQDGIVNKTLVQMMEALDTILSLKLYIVSEKKITVLMICPKEVALILINEQDKSTNQEGGLKDEK